MVKSGSLRILSWFVLLQLLVVIVALSIDLTPTLVMALESTLSLQVQWWLQKAEDLPHVLPRVEEAKPQVFTPDNEETKSEGNHPSIGSVKVEFSANAQSAKPQTECQNTSSNWPVYLQAMYNVLVTLFTMCLFGVGVLQYCVYKKQAVYMRAGLRIGDRSARAAQAAAAAATKSADTVEQALKLTQRARLSVGGWRFLERPSSPEVERFDQITYNLICGGPTSATLIGEYTLIRFIEPFQIRSDYREHLEESKLQVTVIPGGAYGILTHALSVEDLGAVDNGEIPLYAFAYVKYRDVFGDEHETASLQKYDVGLKVFIGVADPNYTFAT
jgi:hypothetical protein